MITREQIPMVLGNPVRDLNGDKIGEVAQVLLDDATGRPKWLCVKTGLLHTRKTFVPPHKATLTAKPCRGPVRQGARQERARRAP